MSRSLLVLPDDSAKPILDAIRTATKSISVKMFVFPDPALLEAVGAARRGGGKVGVRQTPPRRSGEEDNEDTRQKLTRAGIDVVDGNPAFELTHEKSMVVDEQSAFVKSLNWATKNLTETRDYAVVTNHAREVGEIVECFEADWHRKRFDGEQGHLIWCPGGRDRFCRFIEEARHSLFVQNERYQDLVVIECLVRAARQGTSQREAEASELASARSPIDTPPAAASTRDKEKHHAVEEGRFSLIDRGKELRAEFQLPMKLDVGDRHGPSGEKRCPARQDAEGDGDAAGELDDSTEPELSSDRGLEVREH